MKTITALARQFGLSRSTLLYYDRIGLLSPSYRTHAEARLYSAGETARLARIVTYRQAGLALTAIRTLLDAVPGKAQHVLEARLGDIQRQIGEWRAQQRLVVALLTTEVVKGRQPAPTKDEWVALLRACAFSEAEMRAWHAALERETPAVHARFLRRLGLAAGEVQRIRALSRGEWAGPALT